MSRQLLLIPLLIFSGTASAQSDLDDRSKNLLKTAHELVAVDADGCLKTYDANQITVCGKFDADRKHRLPFPELARTPGERQHVPIPNGNPEIVQQGQCYVTLNERNCHTGKVISFSTSFGGPSVGNAPANNRLWQIIKDKDPDEIFVPETANAEISDDD